MIAPGECLVEMTYDIKSLRDKLFRRNINKYL